MLPSHSYSDPNARLYEVMVNGEGVRLSATCEQGHDLVVDLMERLGLFDRPPPPRPSAARTDYADHSGIQFLAKGDRPVLDAGTDPVRRPATTMEQPLPAVPLKVAEPELRHFQSHQVDPSAASSPVIHHTSSPDPVEPPSVPASPRLTELTDRHLRNLKRGPQKATPPGRDRAYALKFLADVIGDKPLDAITVEDAETFADVLGVWPVYLKNCPDFRDMSAVNIAAKAKRERRKPIQRSTQHKHIMNLNAFFNWAIESKVLTENPFRFIQTSRYRDRVPKKKEIFSTKDIEAMFRPDHLRNYTEPHKYWVPLIALYSGMRVNEISQLYVEDVQTDTVTDETGAKRSLMYLDITPYRDGQSVKTPYSVRQIPIHSKLLELGFERYVADVKASGARHLFPGLSWAEGGPGRVVSRWFNKWHLRKSCGITDHAKSLHCFRHTLTTRAERKNVPKSILCAINGHSDGHGIDERTYVARGTLLECHRTLEALEFPPLPLEPYVSERFTPYLAHAAAEMEHKTRLEDEGIPVVSRKGRPPRRGPFHVQYSARGVQAQSEA